MRPRISTTASVIHRDLIGTVTGTRLKVFNEMEPGPMLAALPSCSIKSSSVRNGVDGDAFALARGKGVGCKG